MIVKICGTTNLEDAHLAHQAGADYFGIVVEHAPSPRSVSLSDAIALRENTALPAVALTVNKSLDFNLELATRLRPSVIQLHGDESAELVCELTARDLVVWKALSDDAQEVLHQADAMREAGVAALLLDSRLQNNGQIIYGGTGHRSDWKLARQLVDEGHRVILAGGLSPSNVAEAIEAVQPWAVDCVSGVEATKGLKDKEAVREFVMKSRSVKYL